MAKIFDYIANKGSLYSETGILGAVTGGLLHTKCNKGWYLPCTASKYITFTLPSLAQKSIITVTKVNNTYTVTQTNTTATITSLVLNNANYLRYIIYDSVASATADLKNIQAWINTLQPLTYQKRLLSLPKPTELKQSGVIAGYNKIRNGIYNDLSIYGKHGVVTNCLSTVKGVRLNGVNSKVVLGNIGNVKSISFRIKLKTTTQPILEKAANSGLIHVLGGTLTSLDFANKYVNGVAGTAITANQWHNVVLTSSSNVVFSAATLGLNNTTYGNFEIEDLKFYSTTVSLQEIKAYHNSFSEVLLHEKFEDMAVGSSILPSGWIKNGGSFICEEHYKKKGELVVNGGFDTNLSSWNPGIDWTWSNGTAKHKSLGNNERMFQNCLTVGKFYKVSFTITASNILGSIDLKLGSSSTKIYTNPTNGQYIYTGACIGNSFLYILGSPTWEGSIDNVSVTEIDPLPNFKNGTKYLRCVTAGIVAIPSKWVNGQIEFNLFKGAETNTIRVQLINPSVSVSTSATYLIIDQNEAISLGSGGVQGFITSNSYVAINTWYKIRLTRTTSGVFTIYILGGAYATWTLVGTATDTTYNTSNYLVLDIDANDRIGEIITYNQIK